MRRARLKLAVIGSSLLHEPLLVMYSLLVFILYRDLGATPFQIGALMMLKPAASIFSLHWSDWINRGSRWLRTSLVLTGILARLPFLLFPWIQSTWLAVALAALFMLFYRGGMPPWMELLRLNASKKERGSILSRGLAVGYATGILLGLGAGLLLDQAPHIWRWLFPLSALVGMVGSLLQATLPAGATTRVARVSLHRPWKQSFELLRRNRPFRLFQLNFMVAAMGLMLLFPALPKYFSEVLELSYTELALAIAACKGIGFVIASPFWGTGISRLAIFRYAALVFAAFGLFGLALLGGYLHVGSIYLAYFIYGAAQAGSKLIWHLCGPLFSGEEDSAPYSATNVVMVGLRGCIGPPLGSLLLLWAAPAVPIMIGILLFGLGSLLALRSARTLDDRTGVEALSSGHFKEDLQGT